MPPRKLAYTPASAPAPDHEPARGPAALFDGLEVRGLPHEMQAVARRKLKLIDAAVSLDALRVPPGNRLAPLMGKRKGQWSIRINDQWRICLRWQDGAAFEVEVVDYY